MKLIHNPNAWSCLLASMTMVLDKSMQELRERVGHDGSKVVFPDLPEPAKRRGFHIQEFIPLILESGFSMMPIEVLPYSTPDGKHEYAVDFPDYESRFWNLINGVPGIFTGLGSKWRHAVAWNGINIYDPYGKIYDFTERNLRIDIFYRFDRIKSL